MKQNQDLLDKIAKFTIGTPISYIEGYIEIKYGWITGVKYNSSSLSELVFVIKSADGDNEYKVNPFNVEAINHHWD